MGLLESQRWYHWLYTKITQIAFHIIFAEKCELKSKINWRSWLTSRNLIGTRWISGPNLKILTWMSLSAGKLKIGLILILSSILPWRSRSISPQYIRDHKQDVLHYWTDISSSILPWRSRSISPQYIRDHKQDVLHYWTEFGDFSWNGWSYRADILVTDTHTDRQTQATTIPESQN